MKDYPILIFYSAEDKCYVGDLPDLKYCSAFGDTPEEALREVLIAKKLWLEVAKELHKPIPKPSLVPQFPRIRKRQPILANGKALRSTSHLKSRVRRSVT